MTFCIPQEFCSSDPYIPYTWQNTAFSTQAYLAVQLSETADHDEGEQKHNEEDEAKGHVDGSADCKSCVKPSLGARSFHDHWSSTLADITDCLSTELQPRFARGASLNHSRDVRVTFRGTACSFWGEFGES